MSLLSCCIDVPVSGFFFFGEKASFISRISVCIKFVAYYLEVSHRRHVCNRLTTTVHFDMSVSTLAAVIASTTVTRKNVSASALFVYYNLTKMLFQKQLYIFQICIPIDNCSALKYVAPV